MVGRALKWLLLGDGTEGLNPQYDIQNILNDRLYPNVKPQNTSYPCVVYTIEKTSPDKIKELRAVNNRVSIDLHILSKEYSELSVLTTLISSQLHRYENSYNSASTVSVGYGTPDTNSPYSFGAFAPASTGKIQYVGGLQIQLIELISIIESYDDKLEIYKNTLTFDLLYIDDLGNWGADVNIKLTDLNLMSSSIAPYPTADPRFKQPIDIDDGINYIFSPSLLQPSPNIDNTTLDNVYEHFKDPSMSANTNRPTLKKDVFNPPKYNGNNFIQFDTDKYLESNFSTNRIFRKYKELTFFTVLKIPNSLASDKQIGVLYKKSSTSQVTSLIYFATQVLYGGSLIKLIGGGMALQNNAGADEGRGFNFFNLTSVPALGINPDLSFEDPFYFAVSFKRKEGDNTYLEGQWEMINSANFTLYGDTNSYNDWDDNSPTYFKESFFNFSTLHSDVTSLDTNGAGTINLNEPFDMYDFVMWPEYMIFGSNKYIQIKRQIIEKHSMYNRTSN
tara:strand:+ start:9375 stop:10886 length:1512 start_codon:yes stop_codon:yes gene_type:complete